jgi:MFS family permease
VGAEGLSRAAASSILTIFVLTNASLGPVIGVIAYRKPHWQSGLVVGVPLASMLAWTAVMIYPTPAPFWLLVLLAIVLGVGGPTSMLAFDYTRVHVRREELGAANGFVNIGGFLAGFVMMALIGFGLDLANTGGNRETLYSASNFRAVLWVQFIVVGLGLAAFLREKHRTEALEQVKPT